MTNIITFLNVKGGVGKTTICLNLAHALKIVDDKSVLLVDLDHQENLSLRAIKNRKEKRSSSYDLISNEEIEAIDCIYDSVVPNTKIIPADIQLQKALKELDPSIDPSLHCVLGDKLKPVLASYDYVLIDTHPTLDLISTIGLMSSNFYCIPIKPEPDSLVGIKWTDSYLKNVVKANKELKDLGIVMTDADRRTNIAIELAETIKRKYRDRFMDTIIGRNVAITDAAMEGKTIFQYDFRQKGCKYFREFAAEVIKKCEGKKIVLGEEQEAEKTG